MATVTEQEKLIEVLKFTPRTYKIRLWGYGGEYVMGEVDRKIYDYFKSRRLDLPEFAWNDEYAEENNIPEDMYPFYPGSWHDCDNMGHCWGVDRGAGTLQVEDENGEVVFEKRLDEISGFGEDDENPEPEWTCDEEIWIDMKPAGTVVFVATSSEKGTFFEGELALKSPFNPGKITLSYDEIDGNEIITKVVYDGEDVENWGGDTTGKGTDFGLYIAGSNKHDGKGYEHYRNMDDIEYTMTDWFPKKVTPVREGVYNVKTAGKNSYTHHAKWTGEKWVNVWSDDEVKIKEWQGLASDPDADWDPAAELDKIISDFTFEQGVEALKQAVAELGKEIGAEEPAQTGWPFAGPAPETPANEEKTLTYWTIKPQDKKSIEEVEHFTKDGMEIVHRTGWRWGEWTVTTNDNNPPEFEIVDGRVDINNCYANNIEDVELVETSDGCWDDMEWPDDIDADERNKLEEAIEEEGYYTALEENDWWSSDTEMYISGPIEISDVTGKVVKVINE